MKHHRCLMTAVVALSVAASAACAGGSTSFHPQLVDTSTPLPTPTGAAPAATGEVRLGCGTYCQTAGGYGAVAAPDMLDVIKLGGGAVSMDADGYVPVTVTCLIPATCRGVIALQIEGYTMPESYTRVEYPGRSDLVVNANSTQTIGVPLNAEGLAFARAHSPVTVDIHADANQTADCSDIPQLAAHCAKAVAADPRAGDGLERGSGGKLQVSAT
jgi:hypothetical protein